MNLRVALKLEKVLVKDLTLRFKDYRKSVWLKANKRLNRLQPIRPR